MKLPLVCSLFLVLFYIAGTNGYTFSSREEQNSNLAADASDGRSNFVEVMEALLNTIEDDNK